VGRATRRESASPASSFSARAPRCTGRGSEIGRARPHGCPNQLQLYASTHVPGHGAARINGMRPGAARVAAGAAGKPPPPSAAPAVVSAAPRAAARPRSVDPPTACDGGDTRVGSGGCQQPPRRPRDGARAHEGETRPRPPGWGGGLPRPPTRGWSSRTGRRRPLMQVPPSRPPPTQTGRAGVVAPRLCRARPWRPPGCAARGPAAGRFSSRRGCAATTTGRERRTADARADCHWRTGVFCGGGGGGGWPARCYHQSLPRAPPPPRRRRRPSTGEPAFGYRQCRRLQGAWRLVCLCSRWPCGVLENGHTPFLLTRSPPTPATDTQAHA